MRQRQTARVFDHPGHVGEPLSQGAGAHGAWVFDNGQHRETKDAQHHSKACGIRDIIDAETDAHRDPAKNIGQKTPQDRAHGQAHGIGPLRFGQRGLDVHIGRGCLEGFDKPRIKRPRPKRPPKTDERKRQRKHIEIAGGEKKRERNQTGNDCSQKDGLASDTVC